MISPIQVALAASFAGIFFACLKWLIERHNKKVALKAAQKRRDDILAQMQAKTAYDQMLAAMPEPPPLSLKATWLDVKKDAQTFFNEFTIPPATPPEKAPVMSDETVLSQVEADVANVVSEAAAPVEAVAADVAPAGIVATIETDVEAFIKKVEAIAAIVGQPLHPLWADIVAFVKKI